MGRSWSWVYLGNDWERYVRVRGELGDAGREIPAGPLINAVADDHRRELLNFDDALELRSEVLWQTTDLAERNIFTSDFLHACCSALAVHRILEDADGDLLVVVDDSLLRWRIAELARGAGRDARTALERMREALQLVRVRLSWKAHGIAHRLLFLRGFRRSRRALRALGGRGRLPSSLDTVLVVWATPETFGDERVTTYIGNVPAVLRNQGQRIGFLAIPTSWVHPLDAILENVRTSRDPVVVPQQLLRWRDVVAIALRTLRAPARARVPFEVGGTDLTGFVLDGLRREWARPRQLWALQFYAVGRALARDVRPRTMLVPYENQPWEKALRLGVHAEAAGTEVVGYQHTPISRRWFPYFPSRRDLMSGALPDRVVVPGEFWRREFLEHGYAAGQLVVAPALRYSHLGDHDLSDRRGRVVLAAGSIGRGDSLELFVKALLALEPLEDVRLLFKPHPFMGGVESFVGAALAATGRDSLPAWAEIVGGSVPEHLPGVGVVLYNTTSVSYEALAAGIPVVFVQSDFWFDCDPIPVEAGVGAEVRTPEELRAVLERMLEESTVEGSAHRTRVREFLADTLADGTAEDYVEIVVGRRR